MLRKLDRLLPNGRRDLLRQLAIWFGFALGYQVARGLADRGSAEAFANARRVMRLEERLGSLPEVGLQRHVIAEGPLLVHAVDWTYWVAQFAVVGAVLLWIYVWRNRAYAKLRDTLIVANTLGLVVYVVLPTAPPRFFPQRGFVDLLGSSEALNHGSPTVRLLANPYAAMPSLHAADALIVGVALAAVFSRRWIKVVFLLWPAWVCFALVATANHYWLDIAAGAALAALGAAGTARFALGSVLRRRSGEAEVDRQLPGDVGPPIRQQPTMLIETRRAARSASNYGFRLGWSEQESGEEVNDGAARSALTRCVAGREGARRVSA